MKQALITGGSGGIGQAIAQSLSDQNTKIWVHYNRNEHAARQVVESLVAKGNQAESIQFDITDWDQCQGKLQTLLDEVKTIDFLIHNAGVHSDAPLPGMEKQQWDSVVDICLNGFFHVTRPLIMPMIRKKRGRIVSISSLAAIHGNRGQANYAAAKAGIIGASRSLAREVAQKGICVNVVAPGFIETDMIGEIPKETIRQNVPMQRAGRPEEVSGVVSFLCSDAASYITGEVINVSGGVI